MSGYFYRGRHRKPTTTGKTAAKIAVVGVVSLPLGMAAQGAASADPLDAIAACESSGDPQATNGSHFGLYQFDLPTWRSVGGTGNPMNASAAEQTKRAQMLFAQRGTQPWAASAHCWSGKVGSSSGSTARSSASTPRRSAPVTAPGRAAVGDTGRAANGTGSYVCDAGHLAFDACDPGNLGERVAYPAYDRRTKQLPAVAAASSSPGGYVVKPGDTLSGIAVSHGKHWRQVAAANRDVVADPDLILPGQHLDV